MIYRDDEPFVSYNVIISREGDTDDTVFLFPFHRSLILYLLDMAQEHPEIFFNDPHEIDHAVMGHIFDDIRSRLAF